MAKKRRKKDVKGKKTSWHWPLLVFAVAFFVRLIYLIDFSNSPLAEYLILDPKFYHNLALQIASGNLLAGDVMFKAPLYPYFLALIYSIGGESLFAARFIQTILGSLSCVLTYLLARRFYSNKIAVTAGLIAAFYGPLLLFDAELLTPALIVFLNLVSIYLLFKYEDSGKIQLLFVSALLLGLSSLARPNVLIFVPGVIIWLFRYCKVSRKLWRRDVIVYVTGVVIMLLPLIARNYAATDQVTLFGNYSVYNFLIGNNAQADGKTAVLPGTSPEFQQGYEDAIQIANRLAGRRLSESELGWFWFKLGLEYVAKNPLDWLWLEAGFRVAVTDDYRDKLGRYTFTAGLRAADLRGARR
jgi:4-amino-4-deoxy-L-arabinose transferase-like glycosyltransferase